MAKPQYNTATHKKTRAYWQPIVTAGEAHCTEPICLLDTRWINPDHNWDLAHERDPHTGHPTGSYLGPAHPTCNRSEGATYRNHRHRPHPIRASRTW